MSPAQSWWPLNGASATYRIVWYPSGNTDMMPGRDPTGNVITGGNWGTPLIDQDEPDIAASEIIQSTDVGTGGSALTLQIDDTASVADAIGEATDYQRTVADTATLADALANTFGFNLADSIALADAISNQPGLNLNDTVALADAISNETGKNLADSISLADSIANTVGKFLADNVSLSDTATPAAGFNTAINDSLLLDDSVVTQIILVVNIDDTLSLSDSISTQTDYSRQIDDTASLADALSTQTDYLRIIVDGLTVSDNQTLDWSGASVEILYWDRGFIRDKSVDPPALSMTTNLTGATMQMGFLRSPDGKLVVKII